MKLVPPVLPSIPRSSRPATSVQIVVEDDPHPVYRCAAPAHGPSCWVCEDGGHVIILTFDQRGER